MPSLGTEGFISSYVTQHSRCGDADHPWLLKAAVGQRINITLIDFTIDQVAAHEVDANLCMVYATIREGINGGIVHTVCGGRKQKFVPVFMSASNIVEIRIISKPKQTNSNGQFLLKYEGLFIFFRATNIFKNVFANIIIYNSL